MKKIYLYGGLMALLLASPTGLSAAFPEQMPKGKTETTVERVAVTGVVMDAHSKAPLVGVQIRAYNDERYAAMSDANGFYTIRLPKAVTSLLMKVDGYEPMQVALNHRTSNVNAALYSKTFSPSYTATTDASKSKSIAVDFRECNISIDDQIQSGLNADVRTVMRSGVPGIGGVMFMNGINSLNRTVQPLIVIDGVIQDMQYNSTSIHEGFYNNILANISIDDIQKISVLKNGTALYGAKAANGVLLIETKRNQSMATKVDVAVSGRYELMPTLPSMMNASEYRSYVSELLGTTETKLTSFKFLREDPDYYYYRQYHNETDWSNEVYRNAFMQTYSINVQGGDDIAIYNLSVGYANAEATLKNNAYNRFNLRLNTNIEISRKISTRFDASYSDVNRNMRDDGAPASLSSSTVTSPGFLSLIKSPFLSPYALTTSGGFSSFYAVEDDYLNEVLGSEASLANPSSILHYGEGKNKNSFGNRYINLTVAPKYQANRNLFIEEMFAFTMVNTDDNYYLPLNGVPSFEIKDLGDVQNYVSALSAHQYLTSSDTHIDWKKRMDGSALHFRGGVRFMSSNYAYTTIVGYNSTSDKTPNMSTSLLYKQTDGDNDRTKSLSYYLLGDYAFREKYYLNAGVSMETSSRFGQDAEGGVNFLGVAWGLFPSVSFAWVMSSEPWFKNNQVLNYMKWNVGYDISGNDDIDYNASRTYFAANNLLTAVDGISFANIGNTSLQWEQTARLTAGVDMKWFNNRLALYANVFKSETDHLLSLQRLHYLTGLASNWNNGGSLENKGYDISFNLKLFNTKPFKMDVGASVAHYDNRITSLPDDNASIYTKIYGATILTEVGSPAGLFYGYRTDGVLTTDQAAKDAKLAITSYSGQAISFEAGDMRFIDSGDGKTLTAADGTVYTVIDEKDMTVIGDPNPDLYGNIYGNISLGRWRLNAVFTYSLGNDVYNYQRSMLESGSLFFNQTTAMKNRWVAEGQETDIPKISYEDEMGNSRFSDRWIEDGSYLRFKSLTLSYDLPLNLSYIQSLSIWAAANNLYTWTNYLGSDPESSLGNSVLLQGIDRGLLPQSRSFSVGIKINL